MTIQEMIDRARVAVDTIKDYDQAQVDKLVYEAAKTIYKNAVWLAEEAVEETGLGFVEDKIAKNTDTPTAFWDYLKDKKSVGIIEEIPSLGLIKVAHPIGVIAAITPATNPTVTPLGNFMHTMKGKNAVIISPAPRAEKTSTDTVNLIREALKKCGAPEDLIQIVPEVTIAKSAELMEKCDLVIATGSSGLTKAAYSSGTPAYGVGPGNPPVILDSDNLLLYPQEEEAEWFEALREAGIVVFDKKEDVDKLRAGFFNGEGKLKSELTGKNADVFAAAGGFDIDNKVKVIALKIDEVGKADPLGKEILGPVVVLKSYDKYEDAVALAIKNMEESGGIGHTAGIFTHDEKHVEYAAERIQVARLLINQPTPDAWGPATNALSPAVSEGCGTWGNNILAGNVDYIHMVNVSQVLKPLDVTLPNGEELFAD